MIDGNSPFAQRLEQNISRSHGILNREINADTTDRGHRVRRVPNAQQTGAKPLQQSVHANRQELHVIPAAQLRYPVSRVRRQPHYLLAKSFESLPAHLFESTFGNDVAALPILTSIDRDEDSAGIEPPHGRDRIVRTSAEAEPQDIHRRSEFFHLQTGLLAHYRISAVRTHYEISAHFDRPIGSICPNTPHAPRLLHEPGYLGLHHKIKFGIASRVLGEKVEKIPLWHQGDETAVGRQVSEVCNGHPQLADLRAELVDFLMRQPEKLFEQPKVVRHLERRWVNRIVAKVAQEIRMLFKNQNFDAVARKQVSQHHAGWSAPGDTTVHGNCLSHCSKVAWVLADRVQNEPSSEHRALHPFLFLFQLGIVAKNALLVERQSPR